MTVSDVIKNLNLPETNLSSEQATQILKVLTEQKQVNKTILRDLVSVGCVPRTELPQNPIFQAA